MSSGDIAGGLWYASAQKLAGEDILKQADVLHRSGFWNAPGGMLVLTNYRLVFCPSRLVFIPLGFRRLWPLSDIMEVGMRRSRSGFVEVIGLNRLSIFECFFIVAHETKHLFSTRYVFEDRKWAAAIAEQRGLPVTQDVFE